MKIEIDQSEKIERTNKDTVIAFSNKISGSLLIRAEDKRKIQDIFREIGKPNIFVYHLFAILIFLLIKEHLKKINQIVIDEEYPGKQRLIKSFLMKEIKKVQPDFLAEDISFYRIGKKSKAHDIAYGVSSNQQSADKVIGVKEELKFLVK